MFFEHSLKNFQGFMLLFSYQCPCCRSCDSSFSLSLRFLFVKNFFHLFLSSFFEVFCCFHNERYLITLFHACQQFFSTFLIQFSSSYNRLIYGNKKRRRRALNPRAAWTTYTLSRGASSTTWVLLHMPESYKIWNFVAHSQRLIILPKRKTFVNTLF